MFFTKFTVFSAALVLSSAAFAAGGSTRLGDGTSGDVPTTPGSKSDAAEVCTAVDGKRQVLRPFSTQSAFYVEASADPTKRPEVKKNYRFEKDASGVAAKSVIEPEMFEFMAEPFGGAPQPRAAWAGTYQITFQGRIRVTDDKGVLVGTFPMECTGALLEYN